MERGPGNRPTKTKGAVNMTNKKFYSWLEEQPEFAAAVEKHLKETTYSIDFMFGIDVSNKNYGAKVNLDHNGREFVVRTASSHWNVEEAAEMIQEMQLALSLAEELNRLVEQFLNMYNVETFQSL